MTDRETITQHDREFATSKIKRASMVTHTLFCSNGQDCQYGPTVEDDDGRVIHIPEQAYSQRGNYFGN